MITHTHTLSYIYAASALSTAAMLERDEAHSAQRAMSSPSTGWTIAEWPTNIQINMHAGAESKDEEEQLLVLNRLVNMYNPSLDWAEEDTGEGVYGQSTNDSQDESATPGPSTTHTRTQIQPPTPTPSKLRDGLYKRFIADACAAAVSAAAERALW
jgi:hypothetical protein